MAFFFYPISHVPACLPAAGATESHSALFLHSPAPSPFFSFPLFSCRLHPSSSFAAEIKAKLMSPFFQWMWLGFYFCTGWNHIQQRVIYWIWTLQLCSQHCGKVLSKTTHFPHYKSCNERRRSKVGVMRNAPFNHLFKMSEWHLNVGGQWHVQNNELLSLSDKVPGTKGWQE